MAYRVDHNRTSSKYNVKDGTYEVVIFSAGFDKTYTGTEYVKLVLKVRSDVTQDEQGEIIEYSIWKSKPEEQRQDDFYGIAVWRLNLVGKFILDQDAKFDTIDDWFKAVTGKPLRVTTEIDDKGYARVRRIEESLYPQVATGFIPVDDKEPLPF